MTSNLLDRWHDRTAWETEVMTRNATLTFDGRTIELPVIEGTEGELAIDISELRAQTGLITLDPGLRQHRRLHKHDHLHRRRERASSAIAASPSSSSPSTPPSSRPPGC